MIDPIALDELIPDWKDKGAPLTVPVTENHHWVLTEKGKFAMPDMLLPPFMRNKGTYTLSLGNLAAGLRGRRRSWGSRSSPASRPPKSCINEDGSVKGVATGDMGIARDGTPSRRLPAGHGAARQLHLLRRRARGAI